MVKKSSTALEDGVGTGKGSSVPGGSTTPCCTLGQPQAVRNIRPCVADLGSFSRRKAGGSQLCYSLDRLTPLKCPRSTRLFAFVQSPDINVLSFSYGLSHSSLGYTGLQLCHSENPVPSTCSAVSVHNMDQTANLYALNHRWFSQMKASNPKYTLPAVGPPLCVADQEAQGFPCCD